MNEHIEVLVAVKPRILYNIGKILLWIVTVLSILAFMMGILGILSILLAIAAGFLAYFLGLRADIEYEYSLTDKEIDIDVIFAKQKRKSITSIDLTKMEIMAPLNSYRLDGYKNRQCKTEDYSSGDANNKGNMYVLYYDGTRKLILEIDERLYKAIYNVAPHKVYNA